MSHDEQTPGERQDQREQRVLQALLQDPFPWTVAELARDMAGKAAGRRMQWPRSTRPGSCIASLCFARPARISRRNGWRSSSPREQRDAWTNCRESRCDATSANTRRPCSAHEPRSWCRYPPPAARTQTHDRRPRARSRHAPDLLVGDRAGQTKPDLEQAHGTRTRSRHSHVCARHDAEVQTQLAARMCEARRALGLTA